MKTIEVPLSLLERAIQCIARAENQGAFKDCVAPRIGQITLIALESYLKAGKVLEFKELDIGDKFKFPPIAGFHLECEKLSSRRYRDECGVAHIIGTIKCEVITK